MRIYLDVCCLNRPFDDQGQDKIRLETEAILMIFDKAKVGEIVCVSSEAVDIELENIPNRERYDAIDKIADQIYSENLDCDDKVKERAMFLTTLGFKKMDALHIAYAEIANVDIFLTVDLPLLSVAKRQKIALKVAVDNPLNWVTNNFM